MKVSTIGRGPIYLWGHVLNLSLVLGEAYELREAIKSRTHWAEHSMPTIDIGDRRKEKIVRGIKRVGAAGGDFKAIVRRG